MIQYALYGTAEYLTNAEQPQSPITLFRWGWGTLVLIRRTQIPSGIIGFASDIHQDIFPLAGVHPHGLASYDSGNFGWLGGTRQARLYTLSPWTRKELSANIAAIFQKEPYTWPEKDKFDKLPELLHLSAEDCLFYENGEKEYSCEITKVSKEEAELLLRYTVNGSNAGDGNESIQNFQMR